MYALAKMALQIEDIGGGRFAINLVSAWNRPELAKAGIGFAKSCQVLLTDMDETLTYQDRLSAGE